MDNRAQAKSVWAKSERHPLRRLLIILLILAALAGVIWFAVSLAHSSKSGGAGGPGRAGGGEELGARRGMSLYMQRVALQGDRAVVEAIAGKRAAGG